MKHIIENSSNVVFLDYDSESETLQVKFKHGGLYSYAPVAKKTVESILGSPSIGKALREFMPNSAKVVKL